MATLKKNSAYYRRIADTVSSTGREMRLGLQLLNSVKQPIVTVFGSHLVSSKSRYFGQARHLGQELGRHGKAILTGGGPGIMEAANAGAYDVGAVSIGMRVKLLKREKVNRNIYSHLISFRFFLVRRFIMSIKSEAMVFYPGGYGTLNELFEYLVLMQNGIVDRVPIVLVNRKYWMGMWNWVEKKIVAEKLLTNHKHDLKLVQFADTVGETLTLLKNV